MQKIVLDIEEDFQVLQIIGQVPTVLLVLVMLFYLYDTPHHYFHRADDYEKGERAVAFYYGGDYGSVEAVTVSIMREWSVIGHAHGSNVNLKDILKPDNYEDRITRRGFLIGIVAGASYAFTADDLIDSFSTQILESIMSSTTATYVTVGIGVLLLIASFFGCYLVERVGRRLTLIGGLFGTALSNALVVLFEALYDSTGKTVYVYLAVVCLCATKLFIGLGAGAPAWFLASELVTPTARTISQTFSTAMLLALSGLVTGIYMAVESMVGIYCLLFLATVPALFSAVVLFWYLPETKGKSVERVVLELGRGRKKIGLLRRFKNYGTLPTNDEGIDSETSDVQPAISRADSSADQVFLGMN